MNTTPLPQAAPRTQHWMKRLCLIAATSVAVVSTAPIALAQARTPGELKNIDIKYPCFTDQSSGAMFYPDDVEIVCYGPELRASDVVWTYNTGSAGSPSGLGWGPGQVSERLDFNDPQNPAFPGNGMNCVSIRWAGAPRPDLEGKFVHIGVHFKPTSGAVHCEIWWTIDGVRITTACDPKLTYICSRTTITICIENPYSFPLYITGCRFFQPTTTALPRLEDLVTGLNPERFGGQWIPAPAPAPVICLAPWCRIYVKLPGPVQWRPVVFQIAASVNAELRPGSDGGPDPGDPFTDVIMTGRSAVIRQADANGDGVVGQSDLGAFRQELNLQNPDLVP